MRLIYIFAVFRPLIDAFATAAVALVVWYGGGQALRGAVSLGTLVAFLIYLKMLFMPLQDLAEKFNIVQSSVVASERLFKMLDTAPEDRGGGEVPEERCGHILFEGVTFAYEEGQPVLRDVSFEVPCGKTVALVGPTGSGKTTITSLLLRFYPLAPDGGRIFVDGLPIEDWDVRELRRQFALVQQDLFLFAGTLRHNITLHGEVSEDRMADALEVSRARMVLSRLPDGLEHAVNERGTVLSQGERQLVSFAQGARARPEGPRARRGHGERGQRHGGAHPAGPRRTPPGPDRGGRGAPALHRAGRRVHPRPEEGADRGARDPRRAPVEERPLRPPLLHPIRWVSEPSRFRAVDKKAPVVPYSSESRARPTGTGGQWMEAEGG